MSRPDLNDLHDRFNSGSMNKKEYEWAKEDHAWEQEDDRIGRRVRRHRFGAKAMVAVSIVVLGVMAYWTIEH